MNETILRVRRKLDKINDENLTHGVFDEVNKDPVMKSHKEYVRILIKDTEKFYKFFTARMPGNKS